ncbi:MAG: hypothetical protein ACRD29_14250 [Acidimicrobiales bacterium]
MTATLTVEESDVVELFFDHGWTDGLPIVPPTPERVAAMLDAAHAEPDEVLGTVAERQRSVTAEHAAINAVMAGCRPEYFPVVLAAVGCLVDPAFNANAAVTSTGGAALCVIVSGPLVGELGFNTGHNALGSGTRANATVGRAIRLIASNVLGAKTGGTDGSSIGHPGKFTLCLAEGDPPAPWEPLRAELGYGLDDTTVTLVATEGPRQVANHLNPDAEGILRTFAAAMRSPATFSVGKGGQVVLVLGPEHTTALVEQGWSRRATREYLARESRIAPAELEAAGVLIETGAQHDMTTGPDGKLPAVPGPDDIFVVTAGGAGAGWSACLPAWAPKLHARAVTRRVAHAGEALPDCGPDSCEISF